MYNLCYEVWMHDEGKGEHEMIGAYWNANAAWAKMLGVHICLGVTVEVIVANGMEYDVTNGVTSRRIDVI